MIRLQIGIVDMNGTEKEMVNLPRLLLLLLLHLHRSFNCPYNGASSGLRKHPTTLQLSMVAVRDEDGTDCKWSVLDISFGSPGDEYYYDFRQSFYVVPLAHPESIPVDNRATSSFPRIDLYWRLMLVCSSAAASTATSPVRVLG